ncbi:MAG: hypothetical protein H7Y86_00420 [Rhizobacter sp.]|nr:hypothetical protein [Ferruginibacter sp.]
MYKKLLTLIITASLLTGCDKENDDLVEPYASDRFPQVIKLDDEGDGGLEDEAGFSCVITLNDRKDPTGQELGGTVIPLPEDAIVSFEIKDLEGFSNLADYITGATAFYEIDDCTTSQDVNIDLNVSLNLATGKGSVRFPKNVKEIELVFETNDAFFDDNVLNTEERSVSIELTGVTAPAASNVVINNASSFKYEVQDDEGIHGDWELDASNAAQFAIFKQLFGFINSDIASLDAADVDKIEISFEYDEINIKVALVETESVTECGVTEIVNKEIEIETSLEELGILSADGDVEFVGEIEQSNGSLKEFVYKGSFAISGSLLTLTLQGEYDDEETDELILLLQK